MKDEKKIPGKRRRRCEQCESLRFDVALVIEPYYKDLKDEENWVALCSECYNANCDDI